MKNLKKLVTTEVEHGKLLLRSVPAGITSLFFLSVVLMNFLANKEIYTGVSWLALDAGLTLSWMTFLCMDMLTKRFGPRASITLSIMAVVVNLFICGLFKIISLIPGNWSQYYTFGQEVINQGLNNTLGGTWYVLFGSTIAFIVSAIVNAITNHTIGKRLKNDNFKSYAIRSYISTMLAQFVDNLVFALIVSHTFFGWSLIQCITCALTGCLIELLCEVIFSPIGYKACQNWEKHKVGADYISKQGEEI